MLNTATVATGAIVGGLAGNVIPPGYHSIALNGLGLVTSLIGVRMFFQSKNAVVVVAAIALGGILGAALGISHMFYVFSEWARQHLGGGGTFNQTLIGTSVLFCVGPMTLLGCLQDGIEGKFEILALKSTLDGIAAIFFAAVDSKGVLATALVVLVVQGTLTLAARRLQKFAKDEHLIAEATAAGGALILATGLGLLEIKKMPVETYLPALILAPVFAAIARRLSKAEEVSLA